MLLATEHHNQSTPEALEFYHHGLDVLLNSQVPFLVGGGYAVHAHTGIARKTKDFDLFLMQSDLDRARAALEAAGYRTELAYPHWLAKAFHGDDFIDLIFNSGNGCCPVDEQWFEHAAPAVVIGQAVQVCPPEESIWQKSFIMERERYDGADIAHLLKACGRTLDWQRLIDRFGANWRVLFAHLSLFGFIYPGHQSDIPEWVMIELSDRLQQELVHPPHAGLKCNGTLLSREQYLVDVNGRGYVDSRLPPNGSMTSEEIQRWTPPQEE
jgi:hypothetical protein